VNFSHLANKFRNKFTRFSGILSQDLDKTAQRFVREAVYGLMASQSVMLKEIGRQQEGDVCLKKIEVRFPGQLQKQADIPQIQPKGPGRAGRYLPAPPQIRTSGFPASGSSEVRFALRIHMNV